MSRGSAASFVIGQAVPVHLVGAHLHTLLLPRFHLRSSAFAWSGSDKIWWSKIFLGSVADQSMGNDLNCLNQKVHKYGSLHLCLNSSTHKLQILQDTALATATLFLRPFHLFRLSTELARGLPPLIMKPSESGK